MKFTLYARMYVYVYNSIYIMISIICVTTEKVSRARTKYKPHRHTSSKEVYQQRRKSGCGHVAYIHFHSVSDFGFERALMAALGLLSCFRTCKRYKVPRYRSRRVNIGNFQLWGRDTDTAVPCTIYCAKTYRAIGQVAGRRKAFGDNDEATNALLRSFTLEWPDSRVFGASCISYTSRYVVERSV